MGDTIEDHDDGATVETAGTTSFSDLLMLSDGVFTSSDHRREINDDISEENDFRFVFTGKTGSRMLCFSGGNQNDDESFFSEPSVPFRDSIFPSCIVKNNSNDICTVDKSSTSNMKKKRTGLGDMQNRDCNSKPGKKFKRNQDKSLVGNSKVRKERLGERIAALQQLVSPYGKTDAASVLHEAMGYIKFLQDQIQVLCSPYLINHSPELRSRGLCLVPVSSTLHVDNSNGADFWSPAMSHSTSPPSPLPSQLPSPLPSQLQ